MNKETVILNFLKRNISLNEIIERLIIEVEMINKRLEALEDDCEDCDCNEECTEQ